MAILSVEKLGLSYAGQRLFSGFDMSLEVGQKAHLIGPSGCGKSSVLAIMLGFVPDFDGVITIDGDVLTAHSVWDIRRKIAYVPQEADLGQGRVAQAIEKPFEYKANGHISLDEHYLNELLERFNLPSKILTQLVGDISGGEKQRIAIIMAVLLRRPIFLFDEPTSALDADNRGAFAEFIREQPDMTAVFVAHDPEIAKLSDVTFDLGRSPVGRPHGE